MEEIWKDIKDYEGLYQVSNYGRVKSMERFINNPLHGKIKIKEIILEPMDDSGGHLKVGLSKDGIVKTPGIHILVAKAFIPNPENKPIVHHIDHNPTNNHVDNLMWVTKSQHVALHPEIIESANKAAAKALSKKVLQIDKITNEIIAEYPSMIEAARRTGINHGNICRCCKGKYSHAGGFIFKYK